MSTSQVQAPLMVPVNVQRRIYEAMQYIGAMAAERAGHGERAQAAVTRTRASLLDGIGMLLSSREVWIDSAPMSFGGVMRGGIVYGMIAREKPDLTATFRHHEIEWTFHS